MHRRTPLFAPRRHRPNLRPLLRGCSDGSRNLCMWVTMLVLPVPAFFIFTGNPVGLIAAMLVPLSGTIWIMSDMPPLRGYAVTKMAVIFGWFCVLAMAHIVI